MERLKEILSELGLRFRFDTAVVDKFDDHDQRLYALEENRKMKDKALLDLQKEVGQLRLTVANMNGKR